MKPAGNKDRFILRIENNEKPGHYRAFLTIKIMRYPNLRYGNPNDLQVEMRGLSVAEVAKRLRRSDRSIRNWLSGAEKMPWWVPEIMRLQRMEHYLIMREMNVRQPLGMVNAVGKIVPINRPAKIAAFNQGVNNNENMDEYLLRDRA